MPELPEVETIVVRLRPRVVGRAIRGVRVLRGDIIHPAGVELGGLVVGRRVADVSRRGKQIIVTLENKRQFFIHLGMTGRLTLEKADALLLPHTHLVFELPGKLEMRFRDPRRFGGLWVLPPNVEPGAGLGTEALELTAADLAAGLSRTGRAIKTALLDQALVAGLGNIYADEALFAAGIHPLTPSNRLGSIQIAGLTRAIKKVLKRALRHKGSTLRDYRDSDGQSGNFQKLHRVYDRAGKPCLHCRTAVVRVVISGRSAHFCPDCQALGASTK
jgi:formamidopyrimidine-DNA glycosylase